MNKRIFIPIFVVVAVLLIPNPVMGQVLNYGIYGTPKPSYVESHYNIKTCDNAFQYKFLCDRIDVLIQQNDQMITNQNSLKAQNDQLITIAKAQVCMTGYASKTSFYDFSAIHGVNCDVGKK